MAAPSRRGAASPGLRSEARATREDDALRRPVGERETQRTSIVATSGPWEQGVRYLYIAGKRTAAADDGTSQTINPFDASPLETLADASPADADAAATAPREAVA